MSNLHFCLIIPTYKYFEDFSINAVSFLLSQLKIHLHLKNLTIKIVISIQYNCKYTKKNMNTIITCYNNYSNSKDMITNFMPILQKLIGGRVDHSDKHQISVVKVRFAPAIPSLFLRSRNSENVGFRQIVSYSLIKAMMLPLT